MDYLEENKLKKELRNMEDMMEELDQRSEKYSRPSHFIWTVINQGSFSKAKSLKDKLHQEKNSLDFEYNDFRQKYGKRYSKMSNEELWEKYESKNVRLNDLRKRLNRVKSVEPDKKGITSIPYKKKYNRVYRKVKKEFLRREGRIFDLVHEIEDNRHIPLAYFLSSYQKEKD